ncbi:MAG: hypothetical protein ACE5M4_14910 [Anaerolineales bacterium]
MDLPDRFDIQKQTGSLEFVVKEPPLFLKLIDLVVLLKREDRFRYLEPSLDPNLVELRLSTEEVAKSS